ncbi:MULTISPECIES: LLM class flavin-dependent oxidoreductase [unclassified Frondihabitans]|uniref:LLM class flavin-dependent oxidoreductase n=1 Tax=unclassified Frondihabitans TaxID=2626248 RepID=UPI000F4F31A3|nr:MULTISPECIES: LLM class flavin-dependent oxidoreductase [unclassified Frondihabitans]RPE78037.1 putative LLM family oxidoreductase [Frondihabitans sp. PhB153]RPF08317.1 putative LLM family oxidoreductase [Frondihabitans sp. PhB161]
MATASNPERELPTLDPAAIQLGLDTFGDVTETASGTPLDGTLLSHAQTIRNLVEQAVLADEVGLDFIGVGEHHRVDFAVSAPEVVLAAIAAKTSRIRLGSAVTVLSSDDPVRVYERFATVDALSNGRAEVILGRGSFTESFPLFGLDLQDYEVLFEEKINLFAELLKDAPVTWEGTKRGALTDQWVYPRPESGTIKTWVGVGGSPQSVIRAAHYGLPLFLAIIGGSPAQFAPYSDLYRRALDQFGHAPQPIAMHSPGFIAATDAEALEILYPYQEAQTNQLGRERGWPPYSREQYLSTAGPEGALYVGSPETVARKIAHNMRLLGATRFDMRYSMGSLPHEQMMKSIELYGREVAPMVRELLAETPAPVAV